MSIPLLKLHNGEKLYFAILETLEKGDQDGQPWMFYQRERRSPLPSWSMEDAMTERINFAHAVIKLIKGDLSE